MEALLRFLLSKDAIESTFKILSYLGTSTVVIGLAKYSSAASGWLAGIPFILLFLFLVTQSFFYALQTIVFPAANTIWPKVYYMKTILALRDKGSKFRWRVIKNIVVTKPGLFLFVAYVALFYFLNGILGVLIGKAGIVVPPL